MMVPAHLYIPSISGRGTGTETYGVCSVLPPDDLWIGLDTYMNCILIYDLLLKVGLMWCATCFICIDRWGNGWWLALSGHWLSCTGCYQYLLNMKLLMSVLPFLHMSASLGCFHPRTFILKNGFDYFPWTSIISYLHTMLKIISRGVSRFVTDSPCGVWGSGWTTCLLCDAAVTPRRVALTCVQRVVNFCHTSSHARHGRRTILSRFANVVHVWRTF